MILVNLRAIILYLQILAYINLFIVTTSAQLRFEDEEEAIRSNCLNKTTCGECIQSHDCLWCSQPDFDDAENNPKPRCNIDLPRSECDQRYILRHKSEQYTISARQIEKANGKLPATSITPQRMKLKLSVGKPVEFPVAIGEMEDYPLDLYFLMDLTKTMEDDKKVLAKEGVALADQMQKLTTKFRLGFGSFIDKVAMPFVQTSPKFLEKLKTQCKECVPPYGFKNHLVLSEPSNSFSEEVEKAKISASSDLPEGGFDALMQVMVCDKEIGWTEQARKFVIFATDDGFHIAGDGKLGGIIRPNDGLCHLDANGEYTHSKELDYPTIAQLNSKAGEKSITVIFSVTSSQVDIYSQLSSRIEGSRVIEMTANSSGIVETVEEEYKKISQTVEISDNFTSQYLSIQYSSKCLETSEFDEKETRLCNGVRVGDVVVFTVTLKLLKCPENKNDWNQIFKIYRSTVPDALLLELEMMCSCPCEQPGGGEPNSDKCNGKGTLKCGLCKCDNNYFGRNCECNYLSANGTKLDENKACKHPGSEDVCSGRGSCVCRECQCSLRANPTEVYSGPFCECDNFSCERINGDLCSGHGACVCGKCACNHGWTGTGCQCSTSSDTCRDVDTDEICGGKDRGECECGKCKCKGLYSGEFCEKCRHDECPNNCAVLKDCVQCRLFATGVLDNPADCELNCYKHNGLSKNDIVDFLKESDDPDSNEVKCIEKDSLDNCTFYFLYNHDRRADTYTIQAQREKECPPEIPIFWISFGIIVLIVVIGLLTLFIWKLIQYMQTKREYSRFKNERQNVNWATGQNILYKEPTTTFNNPMYGGMQQQIGFATGERDDTTQSSSRQRVLKHQESSIDDY